MTRRHAIPTWVRRSVLLLIAAAVVEYFVLPQLAVTRSAHRRRGRPLLRREAHVKARTNQSHSRVEETADRYINKLFHVCITVPGIEKAFDFYRYVLGLESIGGLRNEKADGAVLGFPGQQIEIHADHLCGKRKENATVIDLIEFITPRTVVREGLTNR